VATSDKSSDGESPPPPDDLGKRRAAGRPKGAQSKKTIKKQRFDTEVRQKKTALLAQEPHALQQDASGYDLDRPLTWIYCIKDLDRMSPADQLFLEEHLGYSFATSGIKILLATPHDLARRKTASITSTDDSKEEDVEVASG
jgi:hypothetical protein